MAPNKPQSYKKNKEYTIRDEAQDALLLVTYLENMDKADSEERKRITWSYVDSSRER